MLGSKLPAGNNDVFGHSTPGTWEPGCLTIIRVGTGIATLSQFIGSSAYWCMSRAPEGHDGADLTYARH